MLIAQPVAGFHRDRPSTTLDKAVFSVVRAIITSENYLVKHRTKLSHKQNKRLRSVKVFVHYSTIRMLTSEFRLSLMRPEKSLKLILLVSEFVSIIVGKDTDMNDLFQTLF